MIVSNVEIAITRSKRKTLSIFVERDGSVSALVPDSITEDELYEVLKSKEYQIHKNLAEWKQLNDRRMDREYVSGQSFMYLGRNYRLKLVDETTGSVQFIKNQFIFGKSETEKGREYFIAFYKEKLMNKIQPLVKRCSGQLGVTSRDIRIMDLQNRWASCSSNSNLNFHWKCAMIPMDVLQYIVVHELAHLLHDNHTAQFWNEVDKIIPNYKEHVQWLKENGSRLDV